MAVAFFCAYNIRRLFLANSGLMYVDFLSPKPKTKLLVVWTHRHSYTIEHIQTVFHVCHCKLTAYSIFFLHESLNQMSWVARVSAAHIEQELEE